MESFSKKKLQYLKHAICMMIGNITFYKLNGNNLPIYIKRYCHMLQTVNQGKKSLKFKFRKLNKNLKALKA